MDALSLGVPISAVASLVSLDDVLAMDAWPLGFLVGLDGVARC